jgi:hypothetical protein
MLWRNIDRRFILWGAAGWHISFDVLARVLAGEPNVRIVGADAMNFGWQRLNAEYATGSISKRSTGRHRRLKVVNRGDEARVGLAVRQHRGRSARENTLVS